MQEALLEKALKKVNLSHLSLAYPLSFPKIPPLLCWEELIIELLQLEGKKSLPLSLAILLVHIERMYSLYFSTCWKAT